MGISDDKLAAALLELEAERRRRREARGESSGDVVIVGVPSDDFVFSEDDPDGLITCIITGVPDPDPDEPEQRASTPGPQAIDEIEPIVPYEGPDVRRTYVYSTIRLPSENDEGTVAEGFYRVAGGVLILETKGEEITVTLEAGDDPARIARLLLLESADDEFGAAINYPNQRLA